MEKISSSFSRSASSSDLNPNELQAEKGQTETQSQGDLRPNKFSFSKLFSSISTRPETPSVHLGSPFRTTLASRMSSLMGSLFDLTKAETPSELKHFEVVDANSGKTMIFSSPETVSISSSTTLGFDSLERGSTSPLPQEVSLSQEGFYQAGNQDLKKFVDSLEEKLKQAKAKQDPEEELKKDIDRVSYLINGEKVSDVGTIKTFLGEAAESILPILSQTIPNTATDIISERILKDAPVNTIHAELAMSDSPSCGTTISITKKDENSNFHIEVKSIGAANIFLKKIEQEGRLDFELIILDQEARSSPQPKLSGEGKQFIGLELTKDPDSGSYLIGCSKLVREYKIKKPD